MSTLPLIVLQNNLVQKLTEPAALAARELDIHIHDLSAGDLSGVDRVPPGDNWGPVLIFGSIVFVDQWRQDHPELNQWVHWDDRAYNPAHWSKQLGKYFINRDGYASTVEEFITSYHHEMHIRPCGEIKMIGDAIASESKAGRESIAGLITTPAELKERNIDGDTAIWVSHPKEIIAEIRVWMVDGQPVTASFYRMNGAPYESTSGMTIAEAMTFAGACHCFNHPDRHYVVDLALMYDNFFKVVEYNPIHAAGWYGADPKVIIEALVKAGQNWRSA